MASVGVTKSRPVHLVLSDAVDYRRAFEDLDRQGIDWLDLDALRDLWRLADVGSEHAELSAFGPGFALGYVQGHMSLVRFDRLPGAQGRYYLKCQYCVLHRDQAQARNHFFGVLRPLLAGQCETPPGTAQLLPRLAWQTSREHGRLASLAERPMEPAFRSLLAWLLRHLMVETTPAIVTGSPMDAEPVLDMVELLSLLLPVELRPALTFTTHVCNAAQAAGALRFAVLNYGQRGAPVVRWDAAPELGEQAPAYAALVRDALKGGTLPCLYQAAQQVPLSSPQTPGRDLNDRFGRAVNARLLSPPRSPADLVTEAVLSPDGAQRLNSLVADLSRRRQPAHAEDVVADSLWDQIDTTELSPNVWAANLSLLRPALPAAERRRLDDQALAAGKKKVTAIRAGQGATAALEVALELARSYPWESDIPARLIAPALAAPVPPAEREPCTALLRQWSSLKRDWFAPLLDIPDVDPHLAACLAAQLANWLRHRTVLRRTARRRDSPSPLQALRVGNSTNRTWVVKSFALRGGTWRGGPTGREREGRWGGRDLPADTTRDRVEEESCPHALLFEHAELRQDRQSLAVARRFVDGQPLDELLHSGRLGRARATDVLLDTAAALDHLYEQGRIHGNLHAGNLILSQSGVVLVDERVDLEDLSARERQEFRRNDLEALIEVGDQLLSRTGVPLSQPERAALERNLSRASALEIAEELCSRIQAPAQRASLGRRPSAAAREVRRAGRPLPPARDGLRWRRALRTSLLALVAAAVMTGCGFAAYWAVRLLVPPRETPTVFTTPAPSTGTPISSPSGTATAETSPPPAGTATWPPTAPAGLTRSLRLIAPPPGAELTGEGIAFAWELTGRLRAGEHYRLWLEFPTDERVEILTKRTDRPYLQLSAAELPGGGAGSYTWSVAVVGRRGEAPLQSATQSFTCRPPATPAPHPSPAPTTATPGPAP